MRMPLPAWRAAPTPQKPPAATPAPPPAVSFFVQSPTIYPWSIAKTHWWMGQLPFCAELYPFAALWQFSKSDAPRLGTQQVVLCGSHHPKRAPLAQHDKWHSRQGRHRQLTGFCLPSLCPNSSQAQCQVGGHNWFLLGKFALTLWKQAWQRGVHAKTLTSISLPASFVKAAAQVIWPKGLLGILGVSSLKTTILEIVQDLLNSAPKDWCSKNSVECQSTEVGTS